MIIINSHIKTIDKTPENRENFDVNLNIYIALIAENPHGYSPFDLRFISTYINNQLRHYFITGAMLAANKATLTSQMAEHKAALKMIN